MSNRAVPCWWVNLMLERRAYLAEWRRKADFTLNDRRPIPWLRRFFHFPGCGESRDGERMN